MKIWTSTSPFRAVEVCRFPAGTFVVRGDAEGTGTHCFALCREADDGSMAFVPKVVFFVSPGERAGLSSFDPSSPARSDLVLVAWFFDQIGVSVEGWAQFAGLDVSKVEGELLLGREEALYYAMMGESSPLAYPFDRFFEWALERPAVLRIDGSS